MTPLACNLSAIPGSDRPQYQDLVRQIQAAILERTALPDGYAYRLHNQAIGLLEIAQWMTMERLCCPFLSLQIATSGAEEHWTMTLTGPPGVKPILEAAFPTAVAHALLRAGVHTL